MGVVWRGWYFQNKNYITTGELIWKGTLGHKHSWLGLWMFTLLFHKIVLPGNGAVWIWKVIYKKQGLTKQNTCHSLRFYSKLCFHPQEIFHLYLCMCCVFYIFLKFLQPLAMCEFYPFTVKWLQFYRCYVFGLCEQTWVNQLKYTINSVCLLGI